MKLPCGCDPFDEARPNEVHVGGCKMLGANPLTKQPAAVVAMFEQLNELWYLAHPRTASAGKCSEVASESGNRFGADGK